MMAPCGISDYDPATLGLRLVEWGYKPSHAARLLRMHYEGGDCWDSSGHRLPESLRTLLQTELPLSSVTVRHRQVAVDGTCKLLLGMRDGQTVETVLMPDYRPGRAAGCLSSQVGCAMGCDFCATTKTGFMRNLSAGEIVEQFRALRREAAVAGRKLQTVVFMGMGEPLLNLDSVMTAAERLADNRLGGLGWRQITLSTVGIVPGINALTDSGLNLQLAVSLHAPDDVTRAKLIPVATRYSILEILGAVDRFQAVRKRPVTVQYCLLAGVNDSLEQARQLAELIGKRRLHVNLLRYNATGLGLRGIQYEPTSDEASNGFLELLRARGLVAHMRRSRGPDIDAACGQLRRRNPPMEG
jgi:23S rRNA (adenine2503-C2)-methyltransferase